MVRTLNHVEDEETPDSSSPTERRRVDQKGNASRSKHSETEQRRRSKINERFQILRDLIPENDQKRDKASFLLEVIQYIQFLHEKLQMYEGSCQHWSPEPTKLTPWKINSGPVESFVDQSHFERLLSGHEDNVVHSPTVLSARNSMELDFNGTALQKPTDKLPSGANQGLPLNMPLQPPLFEGVPGQPNQGFFPDAEQFTQQPLRSHIWRGKSCLDDCSVSIYSANEEELKTENGEDSISSVYSQGLLISLTNALRSSGMDLSQSNISVQLDIGKQTDCRSTVAMFDIKDHENSSCLPAIDPVHISESYEHPSKRFRADQS